LAINFEQIKNKLRLKILKKLRTASLNSEFTGSYIKRVFYFLNKTSFFNFFFQK